MTRSLSQALLTFLFWTTSKSFSSEIARQNNREKGDSYREDLRLQLDFLELKLKETKLKSKIPGMYDGRKSIAKCILYNRSCSNEIDGKVS